MIIHTVLPGETVFGIARTYGVPTEQILRDNDLDADTSLVVGQTLVILRYDPVTTVESGDTVAGIAAAYGLTPDAVYRYNPYLGGVSDLSPGQTLALGIAQEKRGPLRINGYAYPFIDRSVLRRTLPWLSDVTWFTYGFHPDGSLVVPDDTEVLDIAADYGAEPIMLLSTLSEEGTFDNRRSSALFADEAVQDTLIGNILAVMQEKGYRGLDIDFEYVPADDAALYPAFVRKVRDVLNANGLFVMVALAPKTSRDQRGLLYQGHDYRALGEAADWCLVMTYEWGYTYGPPLPVAPINEVRRVLDFAVTEIPPEKLLLGMPNYGYDWTLPFVAGSSKARSLGNVAAVDLAREVGADIIYDDTAQAPTFVYTRDGAEHRVWFEDAKSVKAKLDLIDEYGLAGLSVWNVMRYFPAMWLVIGALYDPVPLSVQN